MKDKTNVKSFLSTDKEGIDYIICQICGEKRRCLVQHLIDTHNMSTEKYKKRFDTVTMCEKECKRRSYVMRNLRKKHPQMCEGRNHLEEWHENMRKTNPEEYSKIQTKRAINGGKRTQELYPDLARENGKKTHRLHPEECSLKMKRTQERLKKEDPEQYRKQRSITMKKIDAEWKTRDPKGYFEHHSKIGKKVHRLYPNLAHENGIKSLETIRAGLPYKWWKVSFLSYPEMQCAKKILTRPYNRVNCNIRINEKEIDFFPQIGDKLYVGCFVEYHTFNNGGKDMHGLTFEQYYEERQKIIKDSEFSDVPLIIITNLKEIEI